MSLTTTKDFRLDDYPDLQPFLTDEYLVRNRFFKSKVRDLGKICKRLGITMSGVDYLDDDTTNASLVYERKSGTEKWEILIGTVEGAERIRQLVAHELGHFFAYRHANPTIKDTRIAFNDSLVLEWHDRTITPTDEIDIEEQAEANFIGMNLLMPDDIVRDLLAKNKSVKQMATQFIVPESVVEARLPHFNRMALEDVI